MKVGYLLREMFRLHLLLLDVSCIVITRVL